MIKNLTPDMHGKRISCVISSTEVDDAIIIYTKRNGNMEYFVAQNKIYGSIPDKPHKLRKGYKYCWCIGSGNEEEIKNNHLENVIFKEILSPEIY